MIFSIVVPTVGRRDELGRLFASLAAQSCQDFDLIVVDQNRDGLIDGVVAEWSRKLSIRHIKDSSIRGLSAARNAAMPYILGDIVNFSDDDCWFEPDTLDRVRGLMGTANVISINIKLWKGENRGRLKLNKKDCSFSKYSLFNNFMEACLFFRREDIVRYRFDENMGIGSPTLRWSDEGADLLVRMLADGLSLYHYGNVYINHPDNSSLSKAGNRRSYYYGLGRGHFLRVNRYCLLYTVLMAWAPYGVYALRELIRLNPAGVRFYMDGLYGRVRGYFEPLPRRIQQ